MACLDFTYLYQFQQAISNLAVKLVKLRFTIHSRHDHFEPTDAITLNKSLAIFTTDLWQSRHWFVHHCYDLEERRLTIYAIPYALSTDYSTHPHRFAAGQQRRFTDLKICQPVKWTCRIANSSLVAQSLQGLREARHLHWHFKVQIRIALFLD